MSSVIGIIQDVSDKYNRGWGWESFFDICASYIENQGSLDAFEEHVLQIALNEIEEFGDDEEEEDSDEG